MPSFLRGVLKNEVCDGMRYDEMSGEVMISWR